jgi:hypothetical protein
MIYVRAFKKEDLLAFEPIEPMAKSEIGDEEFAQAIEDSSLAVTGVRDGKVVGCGGVHPVENSNHGEIWLRLSDVCLKHKLDTLRWIKDGLKIVEETFPFEQLNASIRCCFKKSIKLVESLGFSRTQEITHKSKRWVIYSKRIK